MAFRYEFFGFGFADFKHGYASGTEFCERGTDVSACFRRYYVRHGYGNRFAGFRNI
jgi:hypothetical protein